MPQNAKCGKPHVLTSVVEKIKETILCLLSPDSPSHARPKASALQTMSLPSSPLVPGYEALMHFSFLQRAFSNGSRCHVSA